MVFCCKITIGNLIFDSANEIEINKTWKKFTQTAIIKLPKNLYCLKNRQITRITDISELIKKGDKVKIELGYNLELRTEFVGYVARDVTFGMPYVIECEDEMWRLKQYIKEVSIPDATVKQIIQEAAPGYEINCIDELYGDFSEAQKTPVQIFDVLKKRAGLYTFFRGSRLVCGIPYSDVNVSEKIPNYAVGKSVISSNIKSIKTGEGRFKIYGSSIQSNGDVLRLEVGEEGGQIIRINSYPDMNKEDLKKLLDRKLENYKKSSIASGDFLTFGTPYVEHGQAIRYVDKIRDMLDLKILVDEISINVSASNGYRKTISVGKLVP